ncbi:MAG: ATP-dependent Clp protease adapter ClpS [Acidobacteria bacterium]|nr:ATP-dependent Clp protease adapter ClpS [Acidobacteriota bacterium]MCB9397066.1 ATP-dependent Clp protease adapter ClpS [Acidobacteriota bacterium]
MTDPKNKNEVLEKQETRTARPKLYRVILLNDDYTTMEFVVFVLESVFHKNAEEATQLMLQIHHSGRGIAGVYTYEIAEMKALTVIEMARQNEYPLQAILEAE